MAVLALAVTGCQNKTEESENTAAAATTAAEAGTKSEEELTDESSITLGEYKGLSLTMSKAEVTDEEIDEQIGYIVSLFPNEEEVTGRPAQEGDTANIDYEGTKDGVAFAGGTAQGMDLELGSGRFIDGFEDGVIGMEIGEEKDLNLTFPDPYENNPDLAGQPVVFHVKLNSLKVLSDPARDDALAKRAMDDENATMELLEAQIYENLLLQKERSAFYEAGNQALVQIIDNSEITCDPDAVEEMVNQLTQTYTIYASQYGMELEDFLSLFLGMDMAGLEENAENLVKQQMVLDEVIRLENVEPTDEQKEELAKANNFDSVDALIQTYGEESANDLFMMEAAYHFLVDNANVTVTEDSGTAADTPAESTAEETETAAE